MSSSILGAASATGGALDVCLSPQDKLKGNAKVSLAQRKMASIKTTTTTHHLTLDVDMTDASASLDVTLDLEFDLIGADDGDQDMDAGWISDDNLRALEFDDRLNQDIDWVAHDDVETSLKLDFVPGADDVQDFGFDATSFLSPLRGGLSFDDPADVSTCFAESLGADPPLVRGQDAEKLLMSFDTMNFTIPSPTSSSAKKQRVSLFAKKDADAKSAVKTTVGSLSGLVSKGTMSPSLKLKAGPGGADDESHKDDPRAGVGRLAIPGLTEPFLGVLNITTPSANPLADPKKKIGSYSPEARRLRIQKFHEKRKNRTWKKSIKYDCRKKLADDRPRIKGRFVRVLENSGDAKEEDSGNQTPSPNGSPFSSPLATPPTTPAQSSASQAAVAADISAAMPIATQPEGPVMLPPRLVIPVVAPVAVVAAPAKPVCEPAAVPTAASPPQAAAAPAVPPPAPRQPVTVPAAAAVPRLGAISVATATASAAAPVAAPVLVPTVAGVEGTRGSALAGGAVGLTGPATLASS